MTAGNASHRPQPTPNDAARQYYENARGARINTDLLIVEALRRDYPDLHIAVVPQSNCNLLSFAAAGNASLAPIDKEKERLSWRVFAPPARRLDGSRGALSENIIFGKYLLDWQGKEYILVVGNGRDGGFTVVNQYILSASVDATNKMVFEAGIWNNELHNEIWVFDGGRWIKSAELWNSVQKSQWSDVILEDSMKNAIISDVETFFDGRQTYERLKVPWKRGVIYYGPPGNGKTISIKAMMNQLYRRDDPIPTLYVKSLSSIWGPENSISQIFTLARRTAPCYLIFEDLDSLVTDNVRSYFLNAVDGIEKNDGIFMVGSTNHLERLDPGISKRPSRFDRKWLFPNPNEDERTKYMRFWQTKLADNKDLEFPDEICPAAASITKGFSFAYLQEAMVGTLLAIAHQGSGLHSIRSRTADDGHDELERYPLWRQLKAQVRLLRDEIGSGK